MSALDTVKTILEADSTLTTAATGGIWTFDQTGRMGLNRTSTPGAFDSDGIIKPCVLLKRRSSMPDGAIADESAQRASYVTMLEAWFYADADFTAIETMRDRVYTLLHEKRLTGPFYIRWAGDLRDQRDDDLDAFLERSTYQVNGIRS